jgi:hypothetical protein
MIRFSSAISCCIALLFCFSTNADAQFYYKDIWNIQQLTKEFSILKNENIRTVSIKSFEDDGEPSEGFFCERRIDRNFSKSEMISRSNITQQSLLVSYYNDRGWILKTVDSSQTSLARSEYEYDNKGRVTMVTNFTKANDEPTGIIETHQYYYNAAGKPEKMIRKKNNAEVGTNNFTTDEKGNIIEEEEIVKGIKGKKYLYYYDERNRLTDVVHFNERAKRLLPDYMYEYNPAGQVKQMISTEDNISNYYIWKYTYNELRLRETEQCYSKERRLLGTIKYEYK